MAHPADAMTAVHILIATLLLQMGFFSLAWLLLAWQRVAPVASLHWGLATCLLGLSMAAVIGRADWPELSPWLSRGVPNLLNVLAFMVARRGIQVFAHRRRSDGEHAMVLLATVAGVSLALSGAGDARWLIFVASGAMAWSLVRSGAEAVQGLRAEFGPQTAWFCSAPLWLVGTLLGLRAVMPWWSSDHTARPIDGSGTFNVALMLVFIAMGLVLNAGLGAMVVIRLVRRLQFLSLHDPMTGALNRRGLEAALNAEHERLRRHHRAFALVSVDADHFKQVNDRHGHAAGDAVLVELVQRLRKHSRSLDRVGRVGGEEFCLLLPEADGQAAEVVARRLVEAVRAQPFATPAGALGVTVSVGTVVADDPQEDLASLWRRVDAALYAAKSAGRDRVVAAPARASAPRLAAA